METATVSRCRACGTAGHPSGRYCEDCGAYLNPKVDRLARRESHLTRWKTVKACLIFYMIYLATLVIGLLADDSNKLNAIIVCSFVDAALVLLFAFAWRRETGILGQMRIDRSVFHQLCIGMMVLPGLLAVNFAYHEVLIRAFEIETGTVLEPFAEANATLLAMVTYICLLPAVVEEIAFRGLIQTRLMKAVRPGDALVVTAILFAVIHVSVFSGPYLFGLGLFLGWLRVRSNSLIPCMAVHFVHNLVVILIEREALLT